MIERLYFKDNITFPEVSLEFKKGLIVFSGTSGAGKSVIFKSILAAFGMFESFASLLEVSVDDKIDDESIENSEPNVFRVKKDKATRYFINNQAVSKKIIAKINSDNVRYLSAKDYSDFEPSYLLKMLDLVVLKENNEFNKILNEFKSEFKTYELMCEELKKLLADEEKVNDLKEFLSYEINKIKDLNPKIGEYEELLEIKTRLSKKDKIDNVLAKSEGIFAYESSVCELLRLANIDNEFFTSTMRELNEIFNDLSQSDDDLNIEEVLNRIEKLHYLVKKYGSVEDALKILKEKQEELKKYENIDEEKHILNSKLKNKKENLLKMASKISEIRKIYIKKIEKKINEYLNLLYIDDVKLELNEAKLYENGIDIFNFSLNKASFKEISSGELNRLRLAFLASFCDFLDYANGYIFLDEIDANVSGKEAASIANVISKLSKHYQIFAITHMPWLCAKANQHILVSKDNDTSTAKEIFENEKIEELARMVSDEKLNPLAIEFAKNLLLNSESEILPQ